MAFNATFKTGENYRFRHPCNHSSQCRDDLICKNLTDEKYCWMPPRTFNDPYEESSGWFGSPLFLAIMITIIGCICVAVKIGYRFYYARQANTAANNVGVPSATFTSTAYQPTPTAPPTPAYYPPVQPQYVAPVQPQAAPLVQPQYAPQPGLMQPAAYPQPSYQPAPYGTQPPPAYERPPMDVKPTQPTA